MTSFVIRYNRSTGTSEVEEFSGAGSERQAMRARLRIEAEKAPNIEVVSLVSDSLQTVQKTHSRYFRQAANA